MCDVNQVSNYTRIVKYKLLYLYFFLHLICKTDFHGNVYVYILIYPIMKPKSNSTYNAYLYNSEIQNVN